MIHPPNIDTALQTSPAAQQTNNIHPTSAAADYVLTISASNFE